MEGDNDPYFSWPLEGGERAREVWYSLVSHPDLPVGFWYRYTLLSTDSGHREARVWAALTDRTNAPSGTEAVVTRSFPLESADVSGAPFRLSVEENELTSGSAKGSVEDVEWDLSYEPDERTFVPLEGDGMGGETGDHWSANQSVEMTGTVEADGEEYAFEDAPGHQGHTVGTAAPPSWSWTHANSFGDDTVVEALEFAGMATICLRHDGEMYALNTMDQILGGNESVENDPGRWVFEGESDEIELRVEVEADADEDSELWKKAAYLTPDDTVRYVAHASLADIKVEYETEDEDGTLETDSGRAEWAGKNPPVADGYRPEEFARKG